MPLTGKGEKILRNMQEEYGPEKGKSVFYASANKGTISGVHDRESSGADMGPGHWKGLIRGLLRFFAEEAQEEEHQQPADDRGIGVSVLRPPGTGGDQPGRRAGTAFLTRDGQALFVKGDGRWAFPGGHAKDDEKPIETAIREVAEETGHDCDAYDCRDALRYLDHSQAEDGSQYVTFGHLVADAFEPELNKELAQHVWRPIDDPPEPLHPGVATTLGKMRKAAADSLDPLEVTPVESIKEMLNRASKNRDAELGPRELSETTREKIGSPGSEQREDMPESVFLGPNKTYPVKEKRDGGEWKYTRKLLQAAANRARLQKEPAIASKANAILAREFGSEPAQDSRFAEDRASTRSYDSVGRLHVDEANICKAKIDEYLGDEINKVMAGKPGWAELEPEKKYKLFRDPDEIAKAADTAKGLPILFKHKPTSAEDHPADITIGATGGEPVFEYPFLKNSLTIWPQYAVEAIEDNSQKELSPGYAYFADMTPGVFDGQPFDGVMRDIKFNHVALVSEGRQGSSVAVDAVDAAIFSHQWRLIAQAIRDLPQAA